MQNVHWELNIDGWRGMILILKFGELSMDRKSIKPRIKKGMRKFLDFLKDIEPLLRLIEVSIVVGGTVFVSTKANKIAEMELNVEKAALQPEFQVMEYISDSDLGEENVNSILSISNVGGHCKNIEIDTICILEIIYWDNMSSVSKKYKLEDFYFMRSWTGMNSGLICNIKNNYNWNKYCIFANQVLNSEELDSGFTNLYKYVRLSYEDQLGETHIQYYNVNGIYTELLSQDEGLARFKEYDDIEGSFSIDQLTIDNLLQDIQ